MNIICAHEQKNATIAKQGQKPEGRPRRVIAVFAGFLALLANAGAVAALVLIMQCAAVAGPARPAALVLQVQGEIMVQRGNKQKLAAVRMPLVWDDSLKVSPDGSVLLLFDNGKQVSVDSDTEITRELSFMEPGTEREAVTPSSAMILAESDIEMYGGQAAGTRNFGVTFTDPLFVEITSPSGTGIIDTRPTITWVTAAPGAVAILSLKDKIGQELWATDTTDTSVEFDPDLPPLQYNAVYILQLTTVIQEHTVTDSTTFFVLPEEDCAAIREHVQDTEARYAGENDAFARHMILMKYYREKELYMDAVQEMKALIREEPANVFVYLELGDLYRGTGYERGADLMTFKAAQLANEQGDPYSF